MNIVNILNDRQIGKHKKFNKIISKIHGFQCEKVMVYGVWCKFNTNQCRFCGKLNFISIKQLLTT